MECCKIPEPKASPPDRCRHCGARGRRVSRETMESLLEPEAALLIQEVDYYFDRTPDCDVKNPSGKCCLGEVNRVIKQLQEELQEQTVAQTQEGSGP